MTSADAGRCAIRLSGGRMLGYAQYGDPAGTPVFFFHGTPGSRRLRHPDDSIAAALRARIITIDRPGYGLSDFQPGRTLLDWPADVMELAGALGFDRFAVAGFSGGGPHAVACAYRIPDRLVAVALISSLSPFDSAASYRNMVWPVGTLLRLARISQSCLRLVYRPAILSGRKNFDGLVDRIAARLPECDRKVLQRPEVRNVFRESFAEMFRGGTRGAAWEMAMLAAPWGFRLEDIRIPIQVWHGEQDPFHKADPLVRAIPKCEPHLFPEEGHLLFFNHWQEILKCTTESQRAQRGI